MQRLMSGIFRIVSTGALLLVVACQGSTPRAASSSLVGDFEGARFRCNDSDWVNVCLETLRENCYVSIVPGRGLPREPLDRLVMINGEQAKIVRGPKDLVGCVQIKSDREALEYLRFFSSYSLVHLFEDQEIEVHKGTCSFVCLSNEIWQSLGLGEILVEPKADGYEVTRYVIKPAAEIPLVNLYRVTQRVGTDGAIVSLVSELVPLPEEVRLGLAFPRFL